MLAETVLYLFVIGLLALVKTNKRYDSLISAGLLFFVAGGFVFFCLDRASGAETVFSWMWNTSKSGDIKIDINSSMLNYTMIFPLFVMSIGVLMHNLFYKFEQHKKSFSTLVLFNLIAFIMLISGNNFVQIIATVFFIDILGQFFVEDMHAGQRYSLYNLVADMGLFTVLAMVQGNIQNLDVANISRYYETGRHLDFIMFLIMTALAVKFGFVFFQRHLFDLKNAKFHRLFFIPLLSSPISALILLVKLNPLLEVSHSFVPLFYALTFLTAMFGVFQILSATKIKELFIFMNMILFAFLSVLVKCVQYKWSENFSYLLILLFIFNFGLYYIHYILHYTKAHKNVLKSIVVCFLLTHLFALSLMLGSLATSSSFTIICAFMLCWQIGLIKTFSLFRIDVQTTQDNKAEIRPICIMLMLSALNVYFSFSELGYWPFSMWALKFLFVLYLLAQFKIWQRIGDILSKLNKTDYVLRIGQNISWFGKSVLSVLTEFFFIEKSMAPWILSFNNSVISIYRKLSRNGFLYVLLCMILACILVLYAFLKGELL